MKSRFLLLWSSLLVGAFLWFSLGVFTQHSVIAWMGSEPKPDITGTWEFQITPEMKSQVVITEEHIEFDGSKTEYDTRYEGSLIVVSIPIPKESAVPPGAPVRPESVLFLVKKDEKGLRVVAVGLESDVLFTKVEVSE